MVPGAIEIPLICQALAKTRKVDGIVAIGAVIKGETAHFEYVSKIAMDGILQVMLATGVPIGCGILTTYDEAQAINRSQNNNENKGYEAAQTTLSMIALLKTLRKK